MPRTRAGRGSLRTAVATGTNPGRRPAGLEPEARLRTRGVWPDAGAASLPAGGDLGRAAARAWSDAERAVRAERREGGRGRRRPPAAPSPPSALQAPARAALGAAMAAKPKLHYPNGRGRMESVRWVLAAAGVEFDEEFLETKEQLQKLQDGNHLLFQQVPMVEIDGMKLVQTRSILHYIAEKHHLFGRDLKERTLIDMYVEGTLDLLELLIMHPFLKPDDQQKEVVSMAQKAIIRYFPVFEKVLRDHGQRFLVGNQLSLADVILLQTILALEEKIPNILSAFPHLQEFSVKISNVPTIKKFLEPGSKKKPPPDDIYVRTVYNIFMP